MRNKEATSERADSPSKRGTSRQGMAWRPWLRAFHRDAGYTAVGLTLIYAASGIAVNHIADWDPNFRNYETTYTLPTPLPSDESALKARVLTELGVKETPREVYQSSPSNWDILFERHTIHIDTSNGRVVDEGQKPRALLRMANWLHLNRGKKAWSYVADAYAAALLFLAISGMFMLPGKKGFLGGRGFVFVTAGVMIPIVYIGLSGGIH